MDYKEYNEKMRNIAIQLGVAYDVFKAKKHFLKKARDLGKQADKLLQNFLKDVSK